MITDLDTYRATNILDQRHGEDTAWDTSRARFSLLKLLLPTKTASPRKIPDCSARDNG